MSPNHLSPVINRTFRHAELSAERQPALVTALLDQSRLSPYSFLQYDSSLNVTDFLITVVHPKMPLRTRLTITLLLKTKNMVK